MPYGTDDRPAARTLAHGCHDPDASVLDEIEPEAVASPAPAELRRFGVATGEQIVSRQDAVRSSSRRAATTQ
jgi:hypothetical protein